MLFAALLMVAPEPPPVGDGTEPRAPTREESQWCKEDAVHGVVVKFHDPVSFPGFPERVGKFEKAFIAALAQQGIQTAPVEEAADVTIMILLESDRVLSAGWKFFHITKWIKHTLLEFAVAEGHYLEFPFNLRVYTVMDDSPLLPVFQGGTKIYFGEWKKNFNPTKRAATLASQLKEQQELFCAGER